MNDKKLEAENNSLNATKSARRKFLVRASAGTLIATLPAKTVWANVITNSMVASGHGSDFNSGTAVKLKWPSYWEHRMDDISGIDTKFSMIFGGAPLKNTSLSLFDDWLTLRAVLSEKAVNSSNVEYHKYAGPSNINRLLISTYFAAVYTNSGVFNVDYPVVGGHDKPFQSYSDFAHKLYNLAKTNPSHFASDLKKLIKSPTSIIV